MNLLPEDKYIQALKVAEIAAFFVLSMPKNHGRLGLHILNPNQSLPNDPKVPLAESTKE